MQSSNSEVVESDSAQGSRDAAVRYSESQIGKAVYDSGGGYR